MISAKSHTADWIKEQASGLGKKVDVKLMEKVIKAFSLLEQLRKAGLELIFKGGTSLILLNDRPKRFSIDIDIISNARPEDLPTIFDKVISLGVFSSWKDDNERKNPTKAPVGHYKFYYKSAVDSNFGEEPILLDVLFSGNYYPTVLEQPVKHRWFEIEGEPMMVKVPALDCILGDKLTAFAPTTIGILYSKNRPTEIIKQLYDISSLMDDTKDLELVKQSYINISKSEIEYRELKCTWKDVLHDTFQACLVISRREESEQFSHMQKGVSNIINFILSRFSIEDAIVCASKAAYLSKTLLQDTMPPLERFSSPAQVTDLEITGVEFNKFNKFKKLNPEAFYYWHKTLTLK